MNTSALGVNIIEFLIQDHDKLRADALEIRKHLSEDIVREKIEKYIRHFEKHEAVEDRFLLDHLKSSTMGTDLKNHITDYEHSHQKIWKCLQILLQDSKEKNFRLLQTDFFNFSALIEGHMFSEERMYFPIFSQHISPLALQELGEKSVEFYKHYDNN